MSKKTKKPQWGTDFSMIIYNPKDETELPPLLDIVYIEEQFVKAVEKKGLVCGGGSKDVRIDIVQCSRCYRNEALEDCDYCLDCLDKIATRHRYKGQSSKREKNGKPETETIARVARKKLQGDEVNF
jgi:hypothetical protein